MPENKKYKGLQSPKYQEKLRNARLCNNDKSAFYLPRQNPCFCLKWLEIKTFGEWEWYLYPHCTPILCGRKIISRTTLDKNEYDLWWKEFLRGLLFVCIKCRFECRLSVGLFIWNCCMCSREMEVEEYEHYDAPKCYQNVLNCY